MRFVPPKFVKTLSLRYQVATGWAMTISHHRATVLVTDHRQCLFRQVDPVAKECDAAISAKEPVPVLWFKTDGLAIVVRQQRSLLVLMKPFRWFRIISPPNPGYYGLFAGAAVCDVFDDYVRPGMPE